MRILLLGRNGQVGWELERALAPIGSVTALGRTNENGFCGDLTKLGEVERTLRRIRPDVIVNAAAYTAVDQAELEPELAKGVNAEAPAALARQARDHGALLVHYSTDYVFDGSGTLPWSEDDDPAPLNVYGATKWQGEQGIRQSGCFHLIFRTSWVYAARGNNFVRTILRFASEREVLQVIDDQVGTPTAAELISDVTAQVVRLACEDRKVCGTYHLAAAGETTWHGYARFVIEAARRGGWPVAVADEAITPVRTEAFPTTARRPHNSRLSCARLETMFGLHMPDWQHGVRRVIAEIAPEGHTRAEGA